MNGIIFSKDRALQLDCLISSIKENCDHFSRLSVLYTTKYTESYQILRDRYPDIEWVEETDFKTDLMELIQLSDERVGLFVDDDIVFRKVDGQELHELMEEVDIVSLRLGDNITQKKHFSYKGSLDGNLYRREDLLPLGDKVFTNPNQLESRLTNMISGTMGWFHQSKLIGIPANRVSNTSGCHHFGLDVLVLNAIFNSKLQIDFHHMDLNHNNVHKIEPFKYRRC